MKTASIVGALALAGTIVTAGACTITTTPAESTSEDGGTRERGGTGAGAAEEAGSHAVPPPAEPTQSETLATFALPEVANIVEVINIDEITTGYIAQQQGTNPDVKAFAQRMVTEHAQAQQRVQKLLGPPGEIEAQQTRLTRDPTASIMLRHGQLLTNDLKAQTGAAFDLTYMTTQISEHAKVLSLIDRALLPSASVAQAQATAPGAAQGSTQGGTQGAGDGGTQGSTQGGSQINSAGLQSELKSLRASVATHLVDALRIQKALRSPPPATTPPATTPGGPAAAHP